MQPHDAVQHVRARQPCVVVDRRPDAYPSVAVRRDREVAAKLEALGGVTRDVAAVLLDQARSADVAVDLAGVLELVAATAGRVLGATVVHVAPDDGELSTVDTPDVCVPVVDAAGTPGGHLHLLTVDGPHATETDRMTLQFLVGYAVDLSSLLVREMGLREALHRAGLEVDSARDDAEHLSRALASNRQIGIAIGVLVALRKVTPEQAFDLLRDASQNSNRKLHDIAADVVLTGALPSPPPRRAVAGSRDRTHDRSAPVGNAEADHRQGRRHGLELTLRGDRADLRLRGVLDLAARAELIAVLHRLDDLPLPVHCDVHAVTFADSHGLEPLVETARRRRLSGREPLLVLQADPAVERTLGLLGMTDPTQSR